MKLIEVIFKVGGIVTFLREVFIVIGCAPVTSTGW